MAPKEWQNNLSILSNIFTHHNLDYDVGFLQDIYNYASGSSFDSIFTVETFIYTKMFVKFTFSDNNFNAKFSIDGEYLFEITKSNIYELSIASAHKLSGNEFCEYCTIDFMGRVK